MYQVYTLPTCEKCHKAVEELKKRKIPYEEIKAASQEGIAKLREFTKMHRERVKREDGCMVLPLIVSDNGQVRIYQGEQGLEEVLHENHGSA